jgi:hypothetical protein
MSEIPSFVRLDQSLAPWADRSACCYQRRIRRTQCLMLFAVSALRGRTSTAFVLALVLRAAATA